MKTFRLQQGDLVLGSGGYETVTGIPKVKQDLACATLEPIGTDRFHPGWGSNLIEHIGLSISRHAAMLIEAEIGRIIRNYVLMQAEMVESDTINDRRTRLSLDEAVAEIGGIKVWQDQDRLIFEASVITMSGDEAVIVEEVTF